MPRREAPPQLFAGRYQLEEELGRGGFGRVHRAWDTQGQRRVAVKIVDRRALELAGGMHRFHREASVLMRLTHPNVVRAYDAGEVEGTPYLVLELLQGVSLEAALRTRGPMPPEKVAAISRDLLGALEEAHARGVVHRDIKPANVFLATADGQETTRLLDFGIAKADGLDAAQTAMGVTLGTAAYMAPEQITGGKIQPATDLFAVGLLMAEMIVGRKIYAATSGLAILVAKANGEPALLPPAVKESAFGPIIARAVQIDPERRYGSAAEMRAMLDRTGGVRTSTSPRASFASAPPRDSPVPHAQETQPSALDATAPQPPMRAAEPSSPQQQTYLPTPRGDTAPSPLVAAVTQPGPTQLREIGSAETAPIVLHAALARPRRWRRWLGIAALFLAAVAVLAQVALPALRSSRRKKGAATTTTFDKDKPLLLEDGKVRMILPGDKPTRVGGITMSAGDFPPRALVECADLGTLRVDEIEARLRTLGKVSVEQRGETISAWTVPDPHDEHGADVTLFDLDSTELAREAARRLRRASPILVGGKRVLTVDDDITLAAVQKAVCRT